MDVRSSCEQIMKPCWCSPLQTGSLADRDSASADRARLPMAKRARRAVHRNRQTGIGVGTRQGRARDDEGLAGNSHLVQPRPAARSCTRPDACRSVGRDRCFRGEIRLGKTNEKRSMVGNTLSGVVCRPSASMTHLDAQRGGIGIRIVPRSENREVNGDKSAWST